MDTISRRTLIRTMAGAGGGLLLGFVFPGATAAVPPPRSWTPMRDGAEINAWLAIDADGSVTIRVPHSEQGQGALTAVSLMVAEELDVPWSSVRAVFADMHRHVNDGQPYRVTTTHGSQLVRLQHRHIMQAGASARERLRAAAAAAWGVPLADVTARQGMLRAAGREATYAAMAGAAATVTLAAEPGIKPPGEWWLLGRPAPRLDVPLKVDGRAQYAIDVRLPDMVYAAARSCPVPWGRLVKYDFDAIRSRPGVIAAVEFRAKPGRRELSDLQDGVAVVADSWWRAEQALAAMPIEWDPYPDGDVDLASQAARMREVLGTPGKLSAESGTDAAGRVAAAREAAARAPRGARPRYVSAEYHRPYEAHVRMEPASATVHVTDARVDVWSPTQNPATPLMLVADQLGRDPREVFAHTVFLGGAFGGNGGGNMAVTRQAAEVANRLRRPVKLLWSRDEDTAQGKHRPPVWARLEAALGDEGLPEAIFTRLGGYTGGGAERIGAGMLDTALSNMPYRVPHRRHERHTVAAHVPTATHRAPGVNQNAFIIEQFVDELALAGGWDPLEWRLRMTEGLEPWQRTLRKLKEVAGFTTRLPRGRGMGVAVVEDHASFCAACATVEVGRQGELKVEKVVIVVNSGYVINPLNAAEQLEGAAYWELSHALYGGLALERGRVTSTNFDKYALLRIDHAPQVECHFAPSQDGWWGGIGEPGGPPTAAAVANAIFFATGKRLRTTPLARQDLRWS
ncbi:MAG: molybdopterin-dependent oxidoreductase [Steroidobacteraceae bacterium]|jgi:isoquinoline 1-oxidoreductase beta subunit|nr:molybdopterin-dependent oxidoreductase [Steroidobacteraceae bacterium]